MSAKGKSVSGLGGRFLSPSSWPLWRLRFQSHLARAIRRPAELAVLVQVRTICPLGRFQLALRALDLRAAAGDQGPEAGPQGGRGQKGEGVGRED